MLVLTREGFHVRIFMLSREGLFDRKFSVPVKVRHQNNSTKLTDTNSIRPTYWKRLIERNEAVPAWDCAARYITVQEGSYMYIYIYIYIYTHIHTYTYTPIHTHTHTHIHVYTYIYTHIHIYTPHQEGNPHPPIECIQSHHPSPPKHQPKRQGISPEGKGPGTSQLSS